MYNPWIYNLYLLQLENYDLKRYWSLLMKRGFLPSSQFKPRQSITWTYKMWMVLFISVLFPTTIFAVGESILLDYTFVFTIFFTLLLFYFLVPFWILAAVKFVSPMDTVIKKNLIANAKSKILEHSSLKVIGIAGSYGKTTAKEYIVSALSASKKVLKTPDNINTPVGIARLILKTDLKLYDVFVVEMGEYKIGDVKEICSLVQPDLAVVTGVNEAHAERMGGIENAKRAIFEVVECAKENSTAFINADDKNCKEYAIKFKNVKYYGLTENTVGFRVIENIFDDSKCVRNVVISDSISSYNVQSKLIGSYAAADIMLALSVANHFKVSLTQAVQAVSALEPVPHRLQIIQGSGGVVVIDDSYNGSPDGVKEALQVLGSFNNRRRVFLSPGLVEMGDLSEKVHQDIGAWLFKAADLVVLIKNSVTPFIAKALEDSGFAKDNILWFNSATEAHTALANILKPGDVVLFQNDWTDNYL